MPRGRYSTIISAHDAGVPGVEPEFQARLPIYLERAFLAASFAAVTVFVVLGIHRPVWLDEANAIRIAGLPFSGIVENLRRDNNLPLYYFLLAPWIRIFGNSEVALRIHSAVFYLGGGAAAVALGRRVCSTWRGAWYTAFFYLCNPLAVRQAQNIRMYGLLGMLSGLSILGFIRVFFDEDRSWRAKGLFLAANALGILTHVWFAFVVAAQLAAILLFAWKRLAVWAGSIVVAVIPFLVFWGKPFFDQLHDGATNWMTIYPAHMLILAPLEFYGFLMAPVYYGAVVCLWIWAGSDRRRVLIQERMVPLMAVLFAVSLGCGLLTSLVRPIYYPGRYAIIALAPLAALLAALFSALLPRILLPLLCFPLLAFGIVNQVAQREEVPETNMPAGQSDRVTAQFLLRHADPGDAIVFLGLTRAAADYYFERDHAASRFLELSFPAENATHPGWAYKTVPRAKRAALEAEARATAHRLQQIIQSGKHVWLYDGGGAPIGGILEQSMDALLPRPRVYPGPYGSHILEFAQAH